MAFSHNTNTFAVYIVSQQTEPLEASPTMYMKAIRNTHGMKTTMTIMRDIKNQRGKKAYSDRTERGKSERRYDTCRDGKSQNNEIRLTNQIKILYKNESILNTDLIQNKIRDLHGLWDQKIRCKQLVMGVRIDVNTENHAL